MATAGAAEFQSIGELFECPVCMEKYRDPRILVCGHHFCLPCLEDICRGQGAGVRVPCPTCRHVTPVPQQPGGGGGGLGKLPRPVIMNELQEKITEFLEHGGSPGGSHGGGHGGREAPIHKSPGPLDLREGAEGVDQLTAPSLTLTPVTNACSLHPCRQITLYCDTCRTSICAECFMGEHEGHQIRDIAAVATEARARLSTLLSNHDSIHDDELYIALIKAKIHEVMDVQANVKNYTNHVRALLREAEAKLGEMERDANDKLMAEIKGMTLVEAEATDLLTSKKSLIDYGVHLVQGAADAEIVAKEAEFPRWSTASSRRRAQWAELPADMHRLETLIPRIEELASSFSLTYLREDIGQLGPLLPADACHMETRHFRSMQIVQKISNKFTIRGMAMDRKRQRIVVRTNDEAGPLKLYDYFGTLRESLGGDLGLCQDKDNRGLAVDSRRDLYIVPVRHALKRVTLAGKLESERKVPKHIAGVAYSRTHDVYVFTASNKIFLTDAETKEAVTSFRQQTTFSSPWHVACGVVSGVNRNKPVIAVSEAGSCCVKLLDFTGAHLRTLGGAGKLNLPWGVSAGPGGELLVCDQYNTRVEALWWCGGDTEAASETLLTKKHGVSKRPLHVTCDPIHRILAISLNNNDIVFYKGQ